MEKYVRVAWPESQEWMNDKYDGQVIQASDEHNIYTFVPEELYNRVKGLVPTKRKNLFLKPANNE